MLLEIYLPVRCDNSSRFLTAGEPRAMVWIVEPLLSTVRKQLVMCSSSPLVTSIITEPKAFPFSFSTIWTQGIIHLEGNVIQIALLSRRIHSHSKFPTRGGIFLFQVLCNFPHSPCPSPLSPHLTPSQHLSPYMPLPAYSWIGLLPVQITVRYP